MDSRYSSIYPYNNPLIAVTRFRQQQQDERCCEYIVAFNYSFLISRVYWRCMWYNVDQSLTAYGLTLISSNKLSPRVRIRNSDVNLVYLLSGQLIFGVIICSVANLSSYLWIWCRLFFGSIFMYVSLIYSRLRPYCDKF